MDHLRKIFEEVLNIHDENCLREVEAASRIRTYKKKEVIIREGEKQSEIPFIISGSCLGYYVDASGKQCTDCIVDYYGCPVTGAGDLSGFDKPSDIYIETLENTQALCVTTEAIIHIVTTYPEVAASMQRIVEYFLMHHRKMQRMFAYPLPQRYQAFCEMFPELSSRLNKTAIAMCLNVSLPALSRALAELDINNC